MALKIFVSHSSKYQDLALKFKLSMQALEAEQHLEIYLSEEMAGASDWRQWIEDSVRSSDLFVLLYPHASMEMAWCNFELGRFCDLDRPIVCIRNTDIAKPPPAFEPYQAYESSAAGLYKFFKELFVDGEFSGGRKLNPAIGDPTDDFHARAREVCNVLAAQYDAARVRQQLYERRLVVSLCYRPDGELDLDATTLHGNTEGMNLIGLTDDQSPPWSTIKSSLGNNAEWMAELEAALPSVRAGALPPALPPYRAAAGGIYLPIVIKADIADDLPRQLVVIFVSAGIERLMPLLGWPLPRAMPENFNYLVQLVRNMFRMRWEILEPRVQEARFRAPSPARGSEIARDVLDDCDRMQAEFERSGLSGLDRFNGAFHKSLRDELAMCTGEWMELITRLRSVQAPPAAELSKLLDALLANNLRWMSIAARQFGHAVDDLS